LILGNDAIRSAKLPPGGCIVRILPHALEIQIWQICG
jgi:hypothetical protein